MKNDSEYLSSKKEARESQDVDFLAFVTLSIMGAILLFYSSASYNATALVGGITCYFLALAYYMHGCYSGIIMETRFK